MRRLVLFLALLQMLSSCALPSPYGARRIPDLPEVQALQLSPDQVQLLPSSELPPNCRRDAILLKAAKITLENGNTHFQIVGGTTAQYAAISASDRTEPSVLIRFCRGVCSGMFSADALAHILVPKFVVPSGFLFSSHKELPECRSDLN
jgi:hypothetical protein